MNLVDDQGIDCPWNLAILSDKDIAAIHNVIRMFCGLVSRKTSDMGDQISVLMVKSLKLAVFMFKLMECCFKAYGIKHVNSTSVL